MLGATKAVEFARTYKFSRFTENPIVALEESVLRISILNISKKYWVDKELDMRVTTHDLRREAKRVQRLAEKFVLELESLSLAMTRMIDFSVYNENIPELNGREQLFESTLSINREFEQALRIDLPHYLQQRVALGDHRFATDFRKRSAKEDVRQCVFKSRGDPRKIAVRSGCIALIGMWEASTMTKFKAGTQTARGLGSENFESREFASEPTEFIYQLLKCIDDDVDRAQVRTGVRETQSMSAK